MEPIIVETAVLSPSVCIGCGGNIGPFVDVAEVEIPTVNGPIPFHVYLCKRVCARSVARVAGFAPGKKMQELANAAEQLAQIQKENDRLQERDVARVQFTIKATKELEEKDRHITHLEGRVKQLEAVIGDKARADLNLVGDAA